MLQVRCQTNSNDLVEASVLEITNEYPSEVFPCPFHHRVFIDEIAPTLTKGVNISFAVTENSKPIAIVPLFVYGKWGVQYGKMSPLFSSGPSFSREFSPNKKVKIALFAKKAIRQLMAEKKLRWVQFRQNVFSQPPFKSLDLGHMIADLALSARSLVVDIRNPEAALDNMESQSRGAIRKAVEEGARVEVKPFETVADADLVSAMHHRVYVSKGYSDSSSDNLEYWRSMRALGGAFLFTAKNRSGDLVAFALVHSWGSFAYYSSGGVVRDEASPTGAGNLLHWEVMQFLHRRGVEWYDMSQSGLMSENTDKRRVAEFKRSLGAVEYPYIKGLVLNEGPLAKKLAKHI